MILPYARIQEFRQEAVYDEGSHTDWVKTKFDIRCECALNANYLEIIVPNLVYTSDPNAAQIMKTIRTMLLKPRKTLSVKFNNLELIPQNLDLVGTVDASNGPQPQTCQIIQMNNVTFLCIYHIVAHYWEKNVVRGAGNEVVNQPGATVLFNRWSETVDIDNRNFTKRTRSGRFVIRTDNKEGFIADQVRNQMAVVGVPKGFLRDSSTYTVDPGGLGIDYRVTDKEAYKMPPKPAFEASGKFTEIGTTNGAIRHGEVDVRLRGDRFTNQAELIETAVAVCSSKLDLNGKISILESITLSVDMYENDVECRMRAMFRPGTRDNAKDRISGVAALDLNEATFTPFSDGVDYQPQYFTRGSASLLLQAAAYYDPSFAAVFDPKTGQFTTGLEPGQAGERLEQ